MKQKILQHGGYGIRDALRDLVPFAKFTKREKHSLTSITFSNVVH